jgi:SlyX protein
MKNPATHEQITMNEAIADLQIRMTHQDDTIDQLNAIVTRQQLELDRLKEEVGRLREVVQDLKDSTATGQGGHELPPHY